jgi:hypothetical protein
MGGFCVERELLLTSCCSSEQGRSEQRQLELLLFLAGAAVRLEKELSRRCSGYRIERLRYHLLVAGFSLLVAAESLLSSREDDTRSWGNFLVYFSHKLTQCHVNLRG